MPSTERTSTEEHETSRQKTSGNTPASELASGQLGDPFRGVFTSAFGEPPSDTAARFVSNSTLSLSANHSFRSIALKRAQQSHGNHFIQRALAKRQSNPAQMIQRECACGGTCTACQQSLNVPGSQAVEAESASNPFVQSKSTSGSANTQPAANHVIPGGEGEPLAERSRSVMESRFGHDFGDVRIHTDDSAAASAEALSANAFTSGRDLYFAAGKYAPETSEGQHLLAHELAHTVQQSEGRALSGVAMHAHDGIMVGRADDPLEQEADRAADATTKQVYTPARDHLTSRSANLSPAAQAIQRQPSDPPSKSDTPSAPVPPTLAHPPGYEVDVLIDDPQLPHERKEQQTFRLQVPTQPPPSQSQFWIVPINKLKLPKVEASKPAPTQATGTPAPDAQPPAHPDIPPGSVVQTIDGAKLTAAASTPDHVITAEYTKYAVGAASTSAIKLADGSVIIIDAGVNNRNLGTTMAALEKLTTDKLSAFIGDGVVRELLISHAHADHVSLAPAILRRFPISFIRLNSVMARWSGYEALRQLLVDAQEQRIKATEAQIKADLQLERAAWETGKGAGYAPDAREVEWQKYVTEQVDRRMAEIPGGRGARERILVQAKKNVLTVADVDLATGQKLGTAPTEPEQQTSPKLSAEDPYATIRETQRPIKSARVRDQRRSTKDADIDPNASAYVVTVPNGMSLLIVPDLRANDLKAIMDNFAKIMGELKRPVQIWDATHHMQKGWYGGGVVPASQMAKIVDFLYRFRSKQGTDVVIVSVEADLSKPGAKTLVDPANVWLLRSLGFEAYLATSGRDVRALDITTSQGTKLTGIVGAKAPGEGPAELSVKRAKMALEKLEAEQQVQRVALKEEQDATKKAEIEQRISEIKALETEMSTAYKECLKEIADNFKADGHTTQTLTTAPPKDFPKQRALDQLLEKHNFDRPVTTDLQLTEMALVVLNQDPGTSAPAPGTPAARARELADIRTRLHAIEARIKAGEAATDAQAKVITQELVIELELYLAKLNNELNPSDPAQKPIEGVSRTLLEDDLKTQDARLKSLKVDEGTTEYSRKLGSGELVQQHAYVVRPIQPAPSRALVAAQQAAEVIGRGAGLLMVVTTVTGEGELMKRWREGQATDMEAALGTAHNITAGVVGLQMLRGVNVNPAVFVVLAALEIGEAAVRHYDTEEQRDIAVGQAEASALINLGCMAVGTAIMKIPHPAAVIAGLIITFLGPVIMRLLGIDEWIEKWRSFNPPEVVEVLQKLRKLLTKYRVIVGSLQLATRAADETDPTITDRAGAKAAAEEIEKKEKEKALTLEQEILTEFEEAYEDAKTNYAGFKDLDTYRAQFYYLRQEAGLAGVAEQYKHSGAIRAPDDVFRNIDISMAVDASLDNMTESQVDDMPQWSHLEEELGDLKELVEVPPAQLDHSKVRDKDKRVQAMIDNARYRLDPSAQGHQRASPLISKDAPIRPYYENKLATYEASLARCRSRLVWEIVPMTGVEAGEQEVTALQSDSPSDPRLHLDWVLATLTMSIRAYNMKVESMPGPPQELATALSTHSAAVARYRTFIENNTDVANGLEWLETTERIIDGYISQAKRMLPASGGQKDEAEAANRKRLTDAEQQMKQAGSTRYSKRGLLYKSELDSIQREVWREEVAQAQMLFTEKEQKVPALTEEEELALTENRSDFNPDEKVIPPLARRLSVVRSPTEVDPQGNFANIFRLTGAVQFDAGVTAVLPHPEYVSPTENALVGLVGPPTPGMSVGSPTSGNRMLKVKVIPLNERAIAVFKGVRVYDVSTENLSPVPAAELEKAKAARALTPATPP